MPSLKPATTGDIASIAQLARTIWEKHYVPIIGRDQVEYMLEKLYSPEALNRQMNEGQRFHLVLQDDRPVGFIAISNPGNKHYFLHKFYLLQEKQNNGLGTSIFKQAFEELYPAQSVRLTVNRQNFKSVNFYFKLGFRIEKVEDFDIGNGYFMNDFVMVWNKN